MGKTFCLIQTIDRSKHYYPENKIVLDVLAAVKIFDDKIGVVQHVKELTKELCDGWNEKYYNKPQASSNFTLITKIKTICILLFILILIVVCFVICSCKKRGPTIRIR